MGLVRPEEGFCASPFVVHVCMESSFTYALVGWWWCWWWWGSLDLLSPSLLATENDSAPYSVDFEMPDISQPPCMTARSFYIYFLYSTYILYKFLDYMPPWINTRFLYVALLASFSFVLQILNPSYNTKDKNMLILIYARECTTHA